jgi:hypothetical protein
MIRYDSGFQIFQYETKSVNLENVSFNSWDQDFFKFGLNELEWCLNDISRA